VCYCRCNCSDEFEDEGVVAEKSAASTRPRTKSDLVASTTSAASEETSGPKEPRKEFRRISVGAVDSRKRTRKDEEYVPQPVSVDQSLFGFE